MSPEREQEIRGSFDRVRVRKGDPLNEHTFGKIVDALVDLALRLVDLETRIGIERSKWCHHCGAPWDWSRPTCRWCSTHRPPEST